MGQAVAFAVDAIEAEGAVSEPIPVSRWPVLNGQPTMRVEMSFVVPGEPVPKGRARVSTRQVRTSKGMRTAVRMYTPKETEEYEARVRLIAQAHRPTGWPMDCHYALDIEVSRTEQGDWDNYSKCVCDAVNPRRAKRGKRGHAAVPGVLWADDRLVRVAVVRLFDVATAPSLIMRVTAQPVVCDIATCGAETFFPIENRCEACAAMLEAKRAARALPKSPPAKRTKRKS